MPKERDFNIGRMITQTDPEGDVVVKVGNPDGHLMRISSKQVSTVSKVFKAMLGPNWVDNPSTYSSDNPLLLPEDDPQAMEFLFEMAHFKFSSPGFDHIHRISFQLAGVLRQV